MKLETSIDCHKIEILRESDGRILAGVDGEIYLNKEQIKQILYLMEIMEKIEK